MRVAVAVALVLAAVEATAAPARIHTYRRSPKLAITVSSSHHVKTPPAPPETRDPSLTDPLYHEAWDHHDHQRFPQALEAFFRLTTNPDPRLVAAARRGFVIAFAEVGKADKALAMFKRIDATGAMALLEHLAERYVATGRNDRAIYVLGELMRQAPADPRVCEWQTVIARSMLTTPGATHSDKIREIENLVKLYVALDAKKLATVACHDAAAAMSSELARAYHLESARSHGVETFHHAARLYRAYLDGFPTAADHAETAYLHAEVLWSIAERDHTPARAAAFELAATSFDAVVAAKKARPLREAAHAAILAWKSASNLDPDPASYTAGIDHAKATAAATPLPPRADRLWRARAAYEDLVRDSADEEVGTVLFLEAALRWQHGQHDKVIAILAPFMKTHRKHAAAEAAARLLLDAHAKLERTKDLFVHADRFAKDADFMKGKPALAADLAALHSRR